MPKPLSGDEAENATGGRLLADRAIEKIAGPRPVATLRRAAGVGTHRRPLATASQATCQYQQTIADIEGAKNLDQKRLGQAQTELHETQGQIAAARQQLADAGRTAEERNRCYAVIPYEGPNQTHRRPIYLECCADAVILQPEGIELTEEDFDGPMGPGNPLAATLRAVREYMLDSRQFDPQAGDPYPMLLVRPEGIAAYYAARAAMKSWGFEFGYELVDDGWKLAYPPPDGRLAGVVRQVVASARVSQARLAAAAPRAYGRTKTTYHAAPGGGFVRETVPASRDDRGYTPATPAGPIGQATGPGGRAPAAGVAASGGSPHSGPLQQGDGMGVQGPLQQGERTEQGFAGGAAYGGGGSARAGTMQNGGDSPNFRVNESGAVPSHAAYGPPGEPGGNAVPGGNFVAGAAPSQQSFGGTAARGAGSCPNSLPMKEGSECPAASPSGQRTERPDGFVVGQPAREHAASDQPTSSSTAHGRALLPGEWQPVPERPPVRQADNDKDNDKKARAGHHGRSLADERGVDWGLRDTAHGVIGVTRPIRVDCYADRLVVVSDRGPAAGKAIPLGPRTETSVDRADFRDLEPHGRMGYGGTRNVLAARAVRLCRPGRGATVHRFGRTVGRQRNPCREEVRLLSPCAVPHHPLSRSTAIPFWTSWPAS